MILIIQQKTKRLSELAKKGMLRIPPAAEQQQASKDFLFLGLDLAGFSSCAVQRNKGAARVSMKARDPK